MSSLPYLTKQPPLFTGHRKLADCKTDVDVDEKYERRRGASLPASSMIKDYNTIHLNNF